MPHARRSLEPDGTHAGCLHESGAGLPSEQPVPQIVTSLPGSSTATAIEIDDDDEEDEVMSSPIQMPTKDSPSQQSSNNKSPPKETTFFDSPFVAGKNLCEEERDLLEREKQHVSQVKQREAEERFPWRYDTRLKKVVSKVCKSALRPYHPDAYYHRFPPTDDPLYSSPLVNDRTVHLVPDAGLSFKFDKESMCDTFFIYEIPKIRFWNLSSTKQDVLVKEGPLAAARMPFIEEIYVVPQPLEDTCVLVCDNGQFPHYQVSLSQLLKFQHEDNLKYKKTIRQVSSFTNNARMFIAPSLKKELPWKEWIEFLHTHDKTKTTDDSRNQALFMDFGFSSNQGTGRTAASAEDGTSVPLMKPNTEKLREDSRCVEGMVFLNEYVKKLRDAGIIPEEVFAMPEGRRRNFAAKLPGSPSFEAFRIAITFGKSMCGPHQDNHNDPEFPHFVSFSQVFYDLILKLWVRVSVILYTRKSIASTYNRRDTQGEVVKALVDFYKSAPDFRRTASAHPPSQHRKLAGRPFGVFCYGRPCGFDPGTYLGSSAHALTTMVLHFNLDYVETASALRAFAYMGFSPFFFVNACHLILGCGEKTPPVSGARFGHFVLKLMMDLRSQFGENGIPGFRYGASGSIPLSASLPEAAEWDKQCTDMIKVFLESFHVKVGKDPTVTYSSLEKKIVDRICFCGDLGGHHVIAFGAVIGLLPFWMLGYVKVNGQGRPQQTLGKKFGFSSKKDVVQANRKACRFSFKETVFKMMAVMVTLRFLENLECKYHRCLPSKKRGRKSGGDESETEDADLNIFAEGEEHPDSRFHDLQTENQFDMDIMFQDQIRLYYRGRTVILEDSLYFWDCLSASSASNPAQLCTNAQA